MVLRLPWTTARVCPYQCPYLTRAEYKRPLVSTGGLFWLQALAANSVLVASAVGGTRAALRRDSGQRLVDSVGGNDIPAVAGADRVVRQG